MLPNMAIIPDDTRQCHTIKQWGRLASETEDEFTRFECYRQSSGTGGRSIGKAYRAYILLRYGQVEYDRRKAGSKYALTSYPVQWSNMAKRNHWVERASAFDSHQRDLDMAVETEERDQCRQLRKSALHKSLTAGVDALAQVDLSQANLAQAAAIIKMAVRELRTEYHDDSTQVEVSAMLAIIPNELRQGILAMLQIKASGPLALPSPDHDDNDNNIIDNNDT